MHPSQPACIYQQKRINSYAKGRDSYTFFNLLKQGLNIAGTVRLLDMAEQCGLIKNAEQCIQELADVGYRVSVDLLKLIRSE